MFWPPLLWNQDETDEVCNTNYGLQPRYDWALDTFGGANPKHDFASLTNVIFSNGEYDGWLYGGVIEPINDETKVFIIK
jgi:lysosomal Pro-X carboxypeptidase